MSLRIQENFIQDLENFTWGNDWRALKLIKEIRSNSEFYFGQIIRYYGEPDDTQDYDVGNTMQDMAWLGRYEKFVGTKKIIDKDEKSPTYGQRINSSAVTETIEETDKAGNPVQREILIEGKAVYVYNIPVTPENTEKMKTLVGSVSLGQDTQFYFLHGINPPINVDPDTFWNETAAKYMNKLRQAQIERMK